MVNQRVISFCAMLGALCFASIIKFSYVVGSNNLLFSGVNVMYPLLGIFGGYAAIAAILSRLFIRVLFGYTLSASTFAFVVPGICASWYMSSTSRIIRFIVPLVCISLFIVHPVGMRAAPYALFWLIPLGVYLFDLQSLYARMLASTFVAHAVGSVIWLYTVSMTPSMWLALMPVVAIERFVFASAALVTYAVAQRVIQTAKRIYVRGRFGLSHT